ncbi:MAG: DUF3520 domain-containing protein, partial [Planctomycetota bacterium]|nr:DUF3520 domain-containing protein [Planctomycetota bacterium]
TVAKDAKVQVEFDREAVRSYRLLGYENRALDERDFRRDRVDGGEVGAGHSLTALYEVELDPDVELDQSIATLKVRYRNPDTDEVEERQRGLTARDVDRHVTDADPGLRLAAAAALFAEILRRSPVASVWGADLRDVERLLRDLPRRWARDPDVVELEDMVRRVAQMERS